MEQGVTGASHNPATFGPVVGAAVTSRGWGRFGMPSARTGHTCGVPDLEPRGWRKARVWLDIKHGHRTESGASAKGLRMLEKQSPSLQHQDFRSSWKAYEHARNLTKKGGGAYQAEVKEAGNLHPKQQVIQCGHGSGLDMESCECQALSWYLLFQTHL